MTNAALTQSNWKPSNHLLTQSLHMWCFRRFLVFISALVLAQKMWDDTPLVNVDFTILYGLHNLLSLLSSFTVSFTSRVIFLCLRSCFSFSLQSYPELTVKEINFLEKKLLALLEFKVCVFSENSYPCAWNHSSSAICITDIVCPILFWTPRNLQGVWVRTLMFSFQHLRNLSEECL